VLTVAPEQPALATTATSEARITPPIGARTPGKYAYGEGVLGFTNATSAQSATRVP
jgi:hypothetical protein